MYYSYNSFLPPFFLNLYWCSIKLNQSSLNYKSSLPKELISCGCFGDALVLLCLDFFQNACKFVCKWFLVHLLAFPQINRFHIYIGSLQSDVIVDYQGPLPTGLVPSPSISTLATPGMGEELSADFRRSSSPGPSFFANRKDSPLVEHKFLAEARR